MNFKKLMIGVAVVAVLIGTYKFFTKVDRSNPATVANAFTKAMKTGDTKTAGTYFVPNGAEAWRTKVDESISLMKSGTRERYFERVPADAAFTTIAGGSSSAVTVQSADKSCTLEMAQIDGQWFVSKSAL